MVSLYNGLCWSILAVALFVGAMLRIDEVPRRHAPDAYDSGDVRGYHVSTAESFLAGEGWTPRYRYNYIPPPLQAVYIVLIKKIFPSADYHTIRAVQCVLGVMTIGLVYLIGLAVGSPLFGSVAAFVYAIDPDVVGYVSILMTENNYLFLLFSFLLVLLYSERRGTVLPTACSGLLLGLTSLMKPFPMLLAVCLPAYWFLFRKEKRWLRSIVFFSSFLVIISPWIARNYLKYGDLYLISTNAGTALAMSNHPGLDASRPGMIYWANRQAQNPWRVPGIEKRFKGVVDEYGKPEWNKRDKAYMKHTLQYMATNPLHFGRNYSIRLRNVFRYPEYTRPSRFRYSRLGADWPFPQFRNVSVLLGFAGLALFAALEWRRPGFVLIPVWFYFALWTALFHILRDGRSTLPLLLLTGLFAAYALTVPWERLARYRRRAAKTKALPGGEGRGGRPAPRASNSIGHVAEGP
jgi:4-amino-4-deoxy-L-arabinose transferase-like glycosyltransferase